MKPQVRKKAVLDAVEKAKGYCSAFSPSEDTEWVCEPVEISDNSPTLSYGHDDDEAVLMSSLGHGEAGGEDLKFEPEDVSLSTGVDCTFKCYQKAV